MRRGIQSRLERGRESRGEPWRVAGPAGAKVPQQDGARHQRGPGRRPARLERAGVRKRRRTRREDEEGDVPLHNGPRQRAEKCLVMLTTGKVLSRAHVIMGLGRLLCGQLATAPVQARDKYGPD